MVFKAPKLDCKWGNLLWVCIVLYMKLIWCNSFGEICAQLEGGQSAIGICALFYIYIDVP